MNYVTYWIYPKDNCGIFTVWENLPKAVTLFMEDGECYWIIPTTFNGSECYWMIPGTGDPNE